jgi:flavodoxin/NAD-dependent dihydropyrimidine dehydrogenase PreA subunit
MTRALVVYFSQGGTTGRIAEGVATGLRARGHHVELHDLAKGGPPPDPRAYDVLGIGSPAHYYRPAIAVSDYLATLPDLSGKPVFTFILHAVYPGDAGNLVRDALALRGGQEVGYARFLGAGRFLGYLRHGYQFSPGHPGPDGAARAEQFGREVAARVAGATHTRAPRDPPPDLVYRVERRLTSPLLIRHLYSRLFRVDPTRCARCGLCGERCPTGNVVADGDGRRSWGRDCILCFACEASCPREAISAPVTWALFWPFMVYNTRTAAADPAVEHVRVVHANGRTRGDG